MIAGALQASAPLAGRCSHGAPPNGALAGAPQPVLLHALRLLAGRLLACHWRPLPLTGRPLSPLLTGALHLASPPGDSSPALHRSSKWCSKWRSSGAPQGSSTCRATARLPFRCSLRPLFV
ncbi:hypothetical protein ZWY2020_042450 [Hordeum vulgare]|nr:hypothetical protein ZWY2020_042450 [Hordeum vulgare]